MQLQLSYLAVIILVLGATGLLASMRNRWYLRGGKFKVLDAVSLLVLLAGIVFCLATLGLWSIILVLWAIGVAFKYRKEVRRSKV